MWKKFGPVWLTATDGKHILLLVNGTLRILEASPAGCREISSCVLGPGKWWTPLVLYKGRIYCRNFAFQLVCIDVSG